MKTFLPIRYRALVLALLVSLVVVPVSVSAETSQENGSDQSSGDWIVKLNSDWAQFSSSDGVAGFLGDSTRSTFGSDNSSFVVSFDGETSASDAIARLSGHPAVDYIEPDIFYEYQEEFIPNDPLFGDQDWAETVNLPSAWSISSGNPDVVVAVVDSGVRSDHPDLAGQLVEGRNYVGINEDNHDQFDTEDRIGHGTAVAGILGASGNNQTGIAGTSMNVQIMPMRVGDNGGAPVSVIAQAVADAVDMGAKVINLSLGSASPSASLERELDYAEANDVIVVAATGNNTNEVSFPGSYDTTISVGATSLDGSQMASFSSQVSVTDLVAPGVGIVTTFYSPDQGNVYATLDGTSFSTPIVTGTAALIHSVNPELDVHQIRSLLRETAQKTFTEGTAGTGSGLLDANAALREAMLPSYGATWLTADGPVASLAAERSWLWGPHAFDLRTEPYTDAENGLRLVAYYDKSRMEITNPYGDRTSEWHVTNGLLVNEMINGQLQLGDNEFNARQPADIPVAGDPELNGGPTYASFAGVLDPDGEGEGETVTRTLDRDGTVATDPDLADYGVTAAENISETGHYIADVFWEYLNSTGILRQPGQYVEGPIFNPTFFATGFPVTSAYWSQVTVDGVEQDVLVQCFERRCLTFTPGNDPDWQVEMGNVGQHYYRWRHGDVPEGATLQDPSAYAMQNQR